MFRIAVSAVALLALGACGVVYTSPDVEDGSLFGMPTGTDYDVEVVELTYETAVAANLEPYVPPRLPAAFQPEVQQAASERTLAALRESGYAAPAELPPPPSLTSPERRRPGFIPDRLPPRLEARPYRIGVSDVLLLAVNAPATLEDVPGLIDAASKRQGYVVQDDGAIAVPDVGRVMVAGLTLQDAEAELFQAVAAAGIDPSFTLEIAEFNSQRVAVGGLVNMPTVVPITLKPLYLNEALQIAGGIGPIDPDVTAIKIFRDGEEYQISARRFLNDPDVQRFLLLDGDTVFVSTDFQGELAQRRFDEQLQLRAEALRQSEYSLEVEQERRQLALTEQQLLEDSRDLFLARLELGAVKRDHAYLTGEFRQSIRFPLPFETTASLADVMLSEEGRGLDIETADYAEIYVLRGLFSPGSFGGVRAYHLDAENAVNLVTATAFEIRPNDVVFVAEQPITAWNRALSQILPNLFLQASNQLTRN